MISLKNINVYFNKGTALEKHVLRNLSIDIHEGDFVTVIGGNGAGKSTLLNVLTGDILVDRGAVLIDDQEVTRLPTERRSAFVSRVFQDPLVGTCGPLTVEENLALAFKRGQSRGLSPALTPANRRLFRDFLARLNLNLEDRLKDPIGLLSGGQRQAISLIMAVLSPMKILVLDEHTAALDPRIAEFIIDLTREIVAERALTVLMVTHSMHQALAVGNRTIMLSEGEVAFDASGRERSHLKEEDLLRLFKEVIKKHPGEDDVLLDSNV